MKAGDRVELTEDMGELRTGLKGTLVFVTCSVPIDRYPFMTKPEKILGVLFDMKEHPCVGRRILVREKMTYTLVKEKCKTI